MMADKKATYFARFFYWMIVTKNVAAISNKALLNTYH